MKFVHQKPGCVMTAVPLALVRTLADQEIEALPMTLLGAVRDGDSVLVTADSAVWHSDHAGTASYQGTTVKFRPLRNTNALYGFYGEESLGESVAAELEVSQAWANWNELARVTGMFLRARNIMPGLNPNHFTHVMVAGELGGDLGIHRINAWGMPEAQENPAFLGNGRVVAKVGWIAAEAIDPDMSAEDRLRVVMRHTVAEVQPLDGPIRFWRVTRSEGVQELESDQPAPKYRSH
jgi:hypothetical protein